MDKLEYSLRQQLVAAERELDSTTVYRLRRARSEALDNAKKPRFSRLMVPAVGMVTASVVALVLVVSPFTDQGIPDAVSPDNAAFYQDLEFYQWLAENDITRSS